MIKFSKEKILLLHQEMAESTGGDVGVRDEALLESAIENIYATFDGIELYPSKEEKAGEIVVADLELLTATFNNII